MISFLSYRTSGGRRAGRGSGLIRDWNFTGSGLSRETSERKMLRYGRHRCYRVKRWSCVLRALICRSGSSGHDIHHGFQILGHLLLGKVDDLSAGLLRRTGDSESFEKPTSSTCSSPIVSSGVANRSCSGAHRRKVLRCVNRVCRLRQLVHASERASFDAPVLLDCLAACANTARDRHSGTLA